MSDEPGFLAKTAIEFLNRQPPPTAEERSVFYANMRRTEADAHEAANIVKRGGGLNLKTEKRG